MKLLSITTAITLSLCIAGCATPPPPVSHDGLQLVEDRDLDQVYVKPGVNISDYQVFALQPCSVAFRANWMRDQNTGRDFGRSRVTEEDMQMLQDRLAAVCDEYFQQSLLEEPPYTLVDGAQGDAPVLELRPSIIDLDITAPDLNETGMVRTYTTSSGEMTLFLEAYDAASGEIIARVVDHKEDRDDMYLEWTNRASNMADAKRFIRSWTKALRKGLDKTRN
ncbi:DUF3313 family protein [Gilvimarinus sp. SDUM040013]|uniref:DUF3313 family protein n=1 Tax=Gilvimarinus gilvus TaxID=3058038 RepID=A0ABU4RUK3_9GAMM|nr:DUF3313 family protein [Gilvimarinus sp. SDUM040013]MDO3388282.1 DUF3313 family protein [Gilvimarinus sp. SDUM040013]MDX6847832.1 DUF3313 family protein [Gilvimarinus sp. SDUM040013]